MIWLCLFFFACYTLPYPLVHSFVGKEKWELRVCRTLAVVYGSMLVTGAVGMYLTWGSE